MKWRRHGENEERNKANGEMKISRKWRSVMACGGAKAKQRSSRKKI
jgi:hypothetical protein